MLHVPGACRHATPWLQCQNCNSAAERNSSARSVRSVFGVMQDTTVIVQNNNAAGGVA